MKAVVSLSTVLAALLFLASSALAQTGAADEQYGGGPAGDVITGTVEEVGPGGSSVLVSDGESLYDMTITPSTTFVDGLVYIPEDQPPRAPNASDLKPGQEIEVKHTGVLAESYPAQGEAERITFLSPWYEEDGLEERSFVGYLTSVKEGEIRVQQNPDATIDDPGYCEQTLDFTLSDETTVSGSLAVGRQVEVVYLFDPDGVYTLQCPGKFPADSITVISDGGNGGDNGGGDSDGSDSDSGSGDVGGGSGAGSGSDGGAVASDSYATLPDTGGPTVFGMALAVVAVTVLAAVYRVEASRRR